ncbi:MAG: hypothetical protein KKB31_04880 [Nanoarchaeota archaeon]|nr:hypothetical protein [Nanoarchaeota archaeon]
MKTPVSNKTLVYGAGAGVGIVQVALSTKWGQFPVGGVQPPWGNWSAIGNIVIGAIVLGVTGYTKWFTKHTDWKNFLQMYGISVLIGGIVSGTQLANGTSAGYRASMPVLGGANGYFSSTYYPGFKGTFYDRPETRARGFGSDVTRNPMAAIPTTIPYNVINY